MQRVNPTVLAAIALGALILLIVGMMVIGGRSSEDDRLTSGGNAAVAADPEAACASQATYDLIKRELFQRAASLRGSDQASFEQIAAYATLRMESPVLRDENAQIRSITCNGAATLDLPPGVAVVGGRRSLSADVLYTLQPAADGSGNVVTLSNAEEIITPLATLARTTTPAPDDPAAMNVVNGVAPIEPKPAPGIEPVVPAEPPAPADTPPSTAARPSFNCGNARTAGEIAVCNDPRLADLDRRMASQFRSAIADATPQQRAILNRTRDAFLRYRDQCPNAACVAETYRGRMREIRDIMRGNWTPAR